jgi:hypothetical protein
MWLGTCATAVAVNIKANTIDHTDLREFIFLPPLF